LDVDAIVAFFDTVAVLLELTCDAAFVGFAVGMAFPGFRAGCATVFFAAGFAGACVLAAGLAAIFFPDFFRAGTAGLRAGFVAGLTDFFGFCVFCGLRAFAAAVFFAGLALPAALAFFFAADAGLRFWFAIFLTIESRRSRVIAQVTPSSNHLKWADLSTATESGSLPAGTRRHVHCCKARNCSAPKSDRLIMNTIYAP
jgi:hypothetical protein